MTSAQQLERAVSGTATVLGRYAQGLTDAADLLDRNETISSDTFVF